MHEADSPVFDVFEKVLMFADKAIGFGSAVDNEVPVLILEGIEEIVVWLKMAYLKSSFVERPIGAT